MGRYAAYFFCAAGRAHLLGGGNELRADVNQWLLKAANDPRDNKAIVLKAAYRRPIDS